MATILTRAPGPGGAGPVHHHRHHGLPPPRRHPQRAVPVKREHGAVVARAGDARPALAHVPRHVAGLQRRGLPPDLRARHRARRPRRRPARRRPSCGPAWTGRAPRRRPRRSSRRVSTPRRACRGSWTVAPARRRPGQRRSAPACPGSRPLRWRPGGAAPPWPCPPPCPAACPLAAPTAPLTDPLINPRFGWKMRILWSKNPDLCAGRA